jgi:hypothetical protein
MSERSSARDLVVPALAAFVVGCGGGSSGPQADPQQVTTLATAMLDNIPVPAAVPDCKPADLDGTYPITEATVVRLAKRALNKEGQHEEWTNPSELDYPSARVLIDAGTDDAAKRTAAGELLAAKGFVMYHPDDVDIPIALGFRELKRGYAGFRAIRYDAKGKSSCVVVFAVKNTWQVSEWAQDMVEKSSKVPPDVMQKLQDDFRTQLKATVASLGLPRPVTM